LADRILVFNSGTICADMHNTKNYVEVSNKIMDFIIEDSVG
jgi:hypothetical protein